MLFTSYSVGLVMSRAGLNAAQLTDVKDRLKMVLRAMDIGGDGLTLMVPTIHNKGPASADKVEQLIEPLQKMTGIKIVVAESVCAVEECVALFRDCDEVWCCPGPRQGGVTWRAQHVYALRGQDARPNKYKLIPPWVETAVPEAKTRKEK